MKNSLQIKNLIKQAIDLLPLEFKSRYIQSHLLAALEELKKAENLDKKK
jgi:hypothetical protein